MRRRMMEKVQTSNAKYPLVNGRHEFDRGYVEITNGSHVKIENIADNSYVNLSNINRNSSVPSETNNINFLPIWITLPEQSDCVLKILNINRIGIATSIGINFRKANSAQSLGFSNGNFTDSEDKIKQVTIEENTGVGCLFMYIANHTQQIEFDVEFTVNGERWI